jgi:ADP-ribose pyrophosphatase YjhB (NUDIX family)
LNSGFIINVSVLIVYNYKFLCIKRSLTEVVFLGYWGIPGGKVEINDGSLEEAIKRECLEEIGVNFTNSYFILVDNNIVIKNNQPILYMVFAAELNDYCCNTGEEVAEVAWKTIDEIVFLDKVTPETISVMKKYLFK